MRCGFCGYEFDEDKGVRGCAGCPTAMGCKMVKCPRCNYENPPEPAWLKRVKSFFGKK